jgi:uncharacterized protein YkwD
MSRPGKAVFAPSPAGIVFRLVLCLGLILPASAGAAALAEDQTILYYLVEAQRQYVKTCNGLPMDGQARSLIPSESLRTLAGMAASSGRPLRDLLEAHGLADAPVFQARAAGASPQQVFSSILAQDCAGLMLPSLRYIGASGANGTWTLLMADREPVFGASSQGTGLPSPPQAPQVPQVPQEGVVPLEDQPGLPGSGEPAGAASGEPSPPSGDAPGGLPPPVSLPEIPAAPASPAAVPPPAVLEADIHPSTRQARIAGSGSGEDLLGLVNEARARGRRCGDDLLPPAPPLVLNPVLADVAMAQVQDMIRGGYFASTRPDGKTLGTRLSEAGYPWNDAAESIASASPPASRAVAAWLNQESQCRTLLSPAYTEAGSAFDGRRNYWVFTLARPLPAGPDAIRLK